MKYRLSTLLIATTIAAICIHELTTVAERQSEFKFRFVSRSDTKHPGTDYWIGLSSQEPASGELQGLSDNQSLVATEMFQHVLHSNEFPADGLEFSVSGVQLCSPLLNRDLGLRLDNKYVSLLIRHRGQKTYKTFVLDSAQREIDADLLLLVAQFEL